MIDLEALFGKIENSGNILIVDYLVEQGIPRDSAQRIMKKSDEALKLGIRTAMEHIKPSPSADHKTQMEGLACLSILIASLGDWADTCEIEATLAASASLRALKGLNPHV